MPKHSRKNGYSSGVDTFASIHLNEHAVKLCSVVIAAAYRFLTDFYLFEKVATETTGIYGDGTKDKV